MTRADEIDPSPALADAYRARKASTGPAEETMRSFENYLDKLTIPPREMGMRLANASTLARASEVTPILRREVLPPRSSWWTRLWLWLVPR